MDLRKYGFTTSDAPDKKKKNESETKEKKKESMKFVSRLCFLKQLFSLFTSFVRFTLPVSS
jgi:hypothetical protein